MKNIYAASGRIWWMVLIRGIFAVLLGIMCFFSPNSTLIAFVILFGIYAVIDGISALFMGISSRKDNTLWSWIVIEGVISILAGIVTLAWPGLTALAIGFIIAFWAVFIGATQVAQSMTLKKSGSSVWGWVLASGVLGILWGLFVFFAPGIGLLTVLWVIGIFALLYGLWTIALSLQLRKAPSVAATI